MLSIDEEKAKENEISTVLSISVNFIIMIIYKGSHKEENYKLEKMSLRRKKCVQKTETF